KLLCDNEPCMTASLVYDSKCIRLRNCTLPKNLNKRRLSSRAVSVLTDTNDKSFAVHPYKKNIFVGLQRPGRMGNLLDVIKSHPVFANNNSTMVRPVQCCPAPGRPIGKVEFSRNIPHIYEIKALHWYPS